MIHADTNRFILTLSCEDVRGIVASVAGFVRDHHGFIIESAQFGDLSTGQFFLRMEFAMEKAAHLEHLKLAFLTDVAEPFNMQWDLQDKAYKPNLLILVSKHSHCLNDLLHRYATGQLAVRIPAVVSNHPDLETPVRWHGIPYHHLPVNAGNKAEQEKALLTLMQDLEVDVVVLARYMQILSEHLCTELEGRAINIHHSFLPSFKGAKPYYQAFDRGVKLIGATAHYVTSDLDEGPIIEQEVARVDHTQGPEQLTAIGRDVEALVLARALKYHIERRVLLNGRKTVVFR